MPKQKLSELKIALVHDFLTSLGGAERVLMALHEIFPNAPIYTLAYDQQGTRHQFDGMDIREAKLAHTLVGRSRKLSLPFLPNAVDTLPLAEYDLVISSSSAFSKGVVTRPETLHICYCHTPMRYAWDWTHEYAKENGYDRGVKGFFYRLVMHYLRLWDWYSAERVDVWLANSKNVAHRIKKYYGKDAAVVYPPVETNYDREITTIPTDVPYFLIISRLSPYKRVDLAIEACAQTNKRLVIIGDGPDRKRLEALAQSLHAPVVFLGYQSDASIHRYYDHCEAFIFAGEDDFGITPVEAMAHGKPVIAFGKGGALETVVDGKTGLFFTEPTAASLTDALIRFDKQQDSFDEKLIRRHAEKFSKEAFSEAILTTIESEWEKFSR